MKFYLSLLFLLAINLTFAQDTVFARKMIDTLSSRYFWGRGYTNNGMAKAADFLSGEIKSYGISPLDGVNYMQPFSYPVNTFPGKMDVEINGVPLVPGKDFIVSPDSRGIKAEGKLVQKDSVTFIDIPDRI